jgi:hypothetical protein
VAKVYISVSLTAGPELENGQDPEPTNVFPFGTSGIEGRAD